MRINDQEANRLRVLKAIRRAEPVARTELVGLTGLPAWAISEIVGDLLRRNLLIEQKAATSARGRPRVQLRLNPEAAYVAAAFLKPDATLAVEMADLRGDVRFATSFDLPRPATVEALAAEIAADIDQAIRTSPVPQKAIHSVGLGLPATIDGPAGVLHWLPPQPPRPVHFAAQVSDALGLPVFLDNTANVLTRAEHWFGEDRQVDDFSLIFVGLGMAAGRYVDGLLRAGGHGLNSEIAHMKLGFGDGPACICGARGCLTTYASLGGVVARCAELRGDPDPAGPVAMIETFRSYADAARAGDAGLRQVFDLAGKALGIGVANYVNVWDPSRVLVRVLDASFTELVEPPFRAALDENTLAPLRGLAKVSFAANTEAAFARGAAALVLERLYRDPATLGLNAHAPAPIARDAPRSQENHR
jgi:predicted NBD/HSP70 family sugar kinase